MPMEMFSSEKNIITPEKVSAVPFGLLNIMVEGMILSAVKQEHIQSAQLPGWCFFFSPLHFSNLYHSSKFPNEQETRMESISLEGRARKMRRRPFLFTQTINRHTCKPRQGQLDNDLDNEAKHCCREWSKQHFILSARG